MIIEPTTDRDCLGQLTKMARELAPTTLMRTVAGRLGTPRAVVKWLQTLPQTDDNGDELYRYVSCDVPQRVRLLPDDPNCFERAFAAIALLEVVDAKTQRMLVTIDHPLRHTGVVERRGGRWVALDLFPRRNIDWGETGKDVLQGVHKYVGKPLLGAYGMGGVADTLGEYEDKGIGRDKKEKKDQPPSQPKPKPQQQQQQPVAKPQQQPAAKPQQKSAAVTRKFDLAGLLGTGAKRVDTTSSKGGTNAEEKSKAPLPVPAGSAAGAGSAAADGDPSGWQPSEKAKRWGWG